MFVCCRLINSRTKRQRKDGSAGLTARSADLGIGGDCLAWKVNAASADKSERELERRMSEEERRWREREERKRR